MVGVAKLRWSLRIVGLAICFLFAVPMQSHAACDSFYRIAAGDTLRTISVRELGTDDYGPLFGANRDARPAAAV